MLLFIRIEFDWKLVRYRIRNIYPNPRVMTRRRVHSGQKSQYCCCRRQEPRGVQDGGCGQDSGPGHAGAPVRQEVSR